MKVTIHFPGALNHLSQCYEVADKLLWIELLENILQHQLQYLFSGETPHNYILLYLNNTQLNTLNNVYINHNDNLNILSAVSGG